MGVSDSKCKTCCITEPILKELKDIFNSNKFLYKDKKIPIARIDMSKKHAFLEKEELMFDSVPKIVIVLYKLKILLY